MSAGSDVLLPDCRVPVYCIKGAVCVIGEEGVGGHVSRCANFGQSGRVRALIVSSRWHRLGGRPSRTWQGTLRI